MTCYQAMVSDLCEKMIGEQLPYKDTILLGDNSSGKSDVLKGVIENGDRRKYYFIDAVNREFDVKQITFEKEKNIVYSSKINDTRLNEDIFNHKDSFYYGGTPKAIEDFYFNYKERLEKLIQIFLQIEFEVKQELTGAVVYVNDERFSLSSGYQALIRIFLEILYYEDTMHEGIIVIDEIDEFLSVKNCGKIFDFLRINFPTLNFIVTTHSADLIAETENANIVLLRNTNYEVLDAGDFRSISQVYDLSDCRQSPRLFAEDFSVLKRLKVSIFKTFQSLFGIIKVSKKAVLFYDDTRNRKSKKANADGMY